MISQEKLYLFILHFINGLYVNLSHLKPGIPNLCQILFGQCVKTKASIIACPDCFFSITDIEK